MTLTTTTEKPKRQNAAFKHLMALHWIMAAFILSLYVTGVFVTRPPQVSFLAGLIPFLHQSLGMLVLMLLIARILLLLRLIGHRYLRRSPKVTLNWLQIAVLHSSLYFFMLLVPVSGFVLRNFIGLDTTLFGIYVPPIFGSDEAWAGLARSSHFWLSYVFLAFILLHIVSKWKYVKRWFSTYQKRFFKVNRGSFEN